MVDPDVRWQQRFSIFCAALDLLELFFEPPALDPREQQGLVKAFDVTFDLGWNTLRDLLRSRGNSAVVLGSRDAISANISERDLIAFQQPRTQLLTLAAEDDRGTAPAPRGSRDCPRKRAKPWCNAWPSILGWSRSGSTAQGR